MPEEILNDISHRRYNPLRDSWLLVSPHRTKRPWQGQQEAPSLNTLPAYDPKCYLCPGNQRASGDSNPKYQNTFAFVNDYSAVKEVQAEYDPPEGKDVASTLLRAEPVTGKCYVLTFSPEHNVTLADMSPSAIVPVIKMWTAIYALHLDPTSPLSELPFESDGGPPGAGNPSAQLGLATPTAQYRYMQIFENKGAAMGCSNPHPHGQIWTTTGLPEEPGMELANLQKYQKENGGRNMLDDYLKLELEKKERIVWQNDTFVILCPWWAVWPFEVMVLPKRHIRAIVELTAAEQIGFAEAISEVTRRYDNLFETIFPYSSGIHQAPLSGTDSECDAAHLHMHFYPPLLRSATVRKFLVGYELMAEPQRDITPEQAAARLRDCGGELYREKLSKEN